ncbi:FTR1 family protein [Telmatospirillum sp.]|uniref:FTR1 family iron permease n=1 Tax=Telmatospirillum sp. TaxID=2079197 RepID=UPI0028416D33|nr:FTR1 family protein [Telmatospirillum sp.]MDR3438292.1 FTR1 family protein [Telmatospirillum sp.]
MLAALLIVFREVIEAGLIVGIVLAATKGVPQRGWWVGGGIAGGLAAACLVAAFAGTIADAFAGSGQELFNASILLIAVAMLTWHNVWMASHGRAIAGQMRALGTAVAAGHRPLTALAVVVGVAVLREGAEVVLFLYGIAAQGGTSAAAMLAGGTLGVAAGAGISALMYGGLLVIPASRLFAVTCGLITLLAAGMASQAVAFLQQGGYATALSIPLWDSSWLLSENSLVGRLLHALVGYTDVPTGLQLTVYIAVILIMRALMWLERPRGRTAANSA